MKKLLLLTLLVGMARIVPAAPNASVITNGTEVTIDVSGGYPDGFTVRDVYGSDITKLIKTGENVAQYYPDEAASYGALEIQRGQFRIKRADQLGAGTVTLGEGACIMLPGVSVKIPNKVIFGSDSYVAAFDNVSAQITLTSIGSSRAAGRRSALVGRTSDGYCKVGLALTGTDCEYMDRLNVRGATDLTLDGGTVKVASEALSPFFYDANGGAYAKSYTVTTNGVAVDVAEGADVMLGIAPTFPVVTVTRTNVVAEAAIANGGFTSTAGWSWGDLEGTGYSTKTDSGTKNNGTDFDTAGSYAFTTTNAPYFMLRVHNYLTRTITVPSDGLWRVAYDEGCRPSGQYSMWMTNVVTISDGGNVIGQTTYMSPTSSANWFGFKRFETVPVQMAAGTDYTLRLELFQATGGGVDRSKSMNFDSFRLEKIEIETETHQGALVKTGSGTLGLAGVADAPIVVSNGTLRIERETLDGLSVAVEGGALEVGSVQATEGTSVAVAAKGVLRFYSPDYTNECFNGDFEADGTYTDATTKGAISGWTFSKVQETSLNRNGSGLQGNGGNVTQTEPWTPASAGPTTAYLREHCQVAKTFTLVRGGTYRLSFLKGCRSVLYSNSMGLDVTIDGETVLTSASSVKGEYVRFEKDIALSAGEHTLAFVSGEPTDRTSLGAMLFIDDVRLTCESLPTEMWSAGEVRLSAGSTLQLDNVSPVVIRNLYVDGVRMHGGRSVLAAAGVNVTGTGKIYADEPKGLMMIVR